MTWRIAAAAAMLAGACVLALFARDALHWQRAMRDGDARAALGYVPPEAWQADAALPNGFIRRVLGIDDDLTFRRVVSTALREDARGPSLLRGARQRALVESALARLTRDDTDDRRAAIAADDLGSMFYFDPPTPAAAQNPYEKQSASGAESPAQKSLQELLVAVRLDPQNSAAQRNFESVLRETRPLHATRIPRAGEGERRGTKGSGSRPPGHGY